MLRKEHGSITSRPFSKLWQTDKRTDQPTQQNDRPTEQPAKKWTDRIIGKLLPTIIIVFLLNLCILLLLFLYLRYVWRSAKIILMDGSAPYVVHGAETQNQTLSRRVFVTLFGACNFIIGSERSLWPGLPVCPWVGRSVIIFWTNGKFHFYAPIGALVLVLIL